jgi:signal transduction histidine kinase
MFREGSVVGTINVGRSAPGPFSPKQIELMQTFADQAVIAIENVRLFNETKEALEQQTATAEILRVIASSPTDLQPVMETVAENAARVCGAMYSSIFRLEGEHLRLVARHGSLPRPLAIGDTVPVSRVSVGGRAVCDRRAVHVRDVLAAEAEFPETVSRTRQAESLARTLLATPLLREGTPLGVIFINRGPEVHPFSEKQIALLETFANQAVIAIENVRLFQELKARNRELTEALEQQTATAEILGVISSSPTEIEPVLQAVAANAARLCNALDAQIFRVEDDVHRRVAKYGQIPPGEPLAGAFPTDRDTTVGRAILDRRTVQVEDLLAVPDEDLRRSRLYQERVGHRSVLATPLLREGVPLGAIAIRRMEAGPFAEPQVRLLETFAAQAVIAIENVRLFHALETRNRALTEALEQQTATAEILRAISSSPTDIQPVLDVVVDKAAQLCNAGDVVVFRIQGDAVLLPAAVRGSIPSIPVGSGEGVPINRGSVTGRAVVERRTVHVEDLATAPETEYPIGREYARRYGHRTTLSTPLLREGVPLGAIMIRRSEVRPFTDEQIALLETFANQAVIAIENVRLFNELRARTGELARSVEELKALGEVGQAVSSTLDLETVLTTIATRADQLSGTDGAAIYEFDEATGTFLVRVALKLEEELLGVLRARPTPLGEGVVGRVGLAREPVQIPDILQDEAYQGPLREVTLRAGNRALLAVPLLREDLLVGALVVRRRAPGRFPEETVTLLQTFAAQSVLAIQNARLFRELADKSRQLEAASRHKSEFLANMSHELRTPLNAIIGFSEVLADRMFGDVNEKQAEYLHDILESGRHLLSLINDILDLSKVEAGRLELELGRFHLPTALDNALTLVRERATRHGITLTQAVDPEVGDIVADERKVKQILLNLLSNAVKFTPEGGRVGLTATAAEGVITIAVSDTGIGIAPEDQAAIFEEFRQVGRDDARKQEGTGLGLTLAKKFVELHGGRIWVESQVGQGATFTFTLPVAATATSRVDWR